MKQQKQLLRPFIVFIALVSVASAANKEMKLHLLEEASLKDDAKCLDGSPSGFYFRESSYSSENWIVHFEGGGWCFNERECLERSKTNLGSSKGWSQTTKDREHIISDDPNQNPSFYSWNHVFVPYCDGGAFTGSREDVSIVNGTRLYFRGRHNMHATWLELIEKFGVSHAKNVIASGSSAGATASMFAANWIRSVLPKNVNFRVVPLSGVFPPLPNVEGQEVRSIEMHDVFYMQNSSGTFERSCIETKTFEESWKCILPEEFLPLIKVPVFTVQSPYDSYSISCIWTASPQRVCSGVKSWKKCVGDSHDCSKEQLRRMKNEWADVYRSIVSSVTFSRPGWGAFLHSCYSHVGEGYDGWTQFKITNGTHFVSASDAVLEWFNSPESSPSKTPFINDCDYYLTKIGCNIQLVDEIVVR